MGGNGGEWVDGWKWSGMGGNVGKLWGMVRNIWEWLGMGRNG